jgi:uncharacterized protein YidB (DUF937 family)
MTMHIRKTSSRTVVIIREPLVIEPEQMETVLGGQTINELAKRFQIPVEQLKTELAAALPEAVDQLTPRGKLPSDADLAKL